MWKSCSDYCQKCHGREGKCVLVDNMECSGGYRCKCSGDWLDTVSMNPLEIDTCAMGLNI
ncbi:hypothetical protein OESDEN_10296 [Oesophagostomum dentatum]|uniref:Uncharacterized protein n=1 Tax=Oesophagostomum dentatum TaxID=61180 RepID=A0A0B1T385_OESDE|nr:hypothetical protein OESDEN_22650 [Oesophagostomum dentatum]KHJ89870.1 hypothetical protein OESDEN_10296 [Oesophagostomum dentatum]